MSPPPPRVAAVFLSSQVDPLFSLSCCLFGSPGSPPLPGLLFFCLSPRGLAAGWQQAANGSRRPAGRVRSRDAPRRRTSGSCAARAGGSRSAACHDARVHSCWEQRWEPTKQHRCWQRGADARGASPMAEHAVDAQLVPSLLQESKSMAAFAHVEWSGMSLRWGETVVCSRTPRCPLPSEWRDRC